MISQETLDNVAKKLYRIIVSFCEDHDIEIKQLENGQLPKWETQPGSFIFPREFYLTGIDGKKDFRTELEETMTALKARGSWTNFKLTHRGVFSIKAEKTDEIYVRACISLCAFNSPTEFADEIPQG